MAEFGESPREAEARKFAFRKSVETYIDGERSRELSAERKKELSRELSDVAAMFEDEKMDFFVAGGTGLDLLDGNWDRDHHDLDVAIFDQDRGRLYDMAKERGFAINAPDRKPLERSDVLDQLSHNAFLSRTDENGTMRFEIMFMSGGEDGVKLAGNATIDAEAFRNAPSATIEGREIRLQPPEMILFHKLTDGRRKDFEDVRKAWQGMDERGMERLQRLIEDAGKSFVIGDQETASVADLLAAAEREDGRKRDTFFRQDVARVETELAGRIDLVIGEIYGMRESASSKEKFLEGMVEKYEGDVPERRAIIDKIVDRLFQDQPPTAEEFARWSRPFFSDTDGVKREALHQYVSQYLWETREKK